MWNKNVSEPECSQKQSQASPKHVDLNPFSIFIHNSGENNMFSQKQLYFPYNAAFKKNWCPSILSIIKRQTNRK